MIIKIDGYTLDAICQYVNENYPQFSEVQVSNVVSTRIEDSFVIVLIDCGIKGTPKFRIPAEKLEFMVKPEVRVKETRTVPVEDNDLSTLIVTELISEQADPIEKPEPEVIFPRAEAGETVLETVRKSPIEIEYIDPKEDKPEPETKKQATNGRRKRGKK